jgi:hypothetical protein
MQFKYVVGSIALLLCVVLLSGLFIDGNTAQASNDQRGYRTFLDHTPQLDTPAPGFTPAALGPNAIPERRPSLLLGASVIAFVIVLGLIVYSRQKNQDHLEKD